MSRQRTDAKVRRINKLLSPSNKHIVRNCQAKNATGLSWTWVHFQVFRSKFLVALQTKTKRNNLWNLTFTSQINIYLLKCLVLGETSQICADNVLASLTEREYPFQGNGDLQKHKLRNVTQKVCTSRLCSVRLYQRQREKHLLLRDGTLFLCLGDTNCSRRSLEWEIEAGLTVLLKQEKKSWTTEFFQVEVVFVLNRNPG